MRQPRLPTGSSDPISYTCTCPASSSPDGGLILLFYRYFASPPSLPPSYLTATSASDLADFYANLTQSLDLGGKIRVSDEGFNITVGGTHASIQEFISKCLTHWSFIGLDLVTNEQQAAFFKPSPGCACCFDNVCSVRVTTEITPMGVTNYVPSNWNSITYLSPAEFHAKCLVEGEEQEVVLLDVRNHYESRIGYFVSPSTGKTALTPQVRRFAQWPLYVRKRLAASLASSDGLDGKGEQQKEKAILTYCTGGIRCEKGARFLADTLANSTTSSPSSKTKVYTLHGGISSYLSWLDTEIALDRMKPSDSLFKGQNYVFDGRGSIGLSSATSSQLSSSHTSVDEQDSVSSCHMCASPSSRLSKCTSKGCHLILVICASCEGGPFPPRCCASCEAMDAALIIPATDNVEKAKHIPRAICDCEKERERSLWGDDSFGKIAKPKTQAKGSKSRGGTRGKGIPSGFGGVDGIEIRIKTID